MLEKSGESGYFFRSRIKDDRCIEKNWGAGRAGIFFVPAFLCRRAAPAEDALHILVRLLTKEAEVLERESL